MPAPIDSELNAFQAATSAQIRTWSSGSLKRRLLPFERRDDWRQTQGTLWDQRIFGPVEDWKCPCGRFEGEEHSGVICPVCGVKVVSRAARRLRFGHVNLPVRIPHPFFAEAEALDAVPVVPPVYWETLAGQPLATAYEELVHLAMLAVPREDLVGAFGVILAHVERAYEHAHESDPDEIERLARGMALVPKPVEVPDDAAGDDDGVDWDQLRLLDE